MAQLSTVIAEDRRNALVSWVLCGVLALTALCVLVTALFGATRLRGFASTLAGRLGSIGQ